MSNETLCGGKFGFGYCEHDFTEEQYEKFQYWNYRLKQTAYDKYPEGHDKFSDMHSGIPRLLVYYMEWQVDKTVDDTQGMMIYLLSVKLSPVQCIFLANPVRDDVDMVEHKSLQILWDFNCLYDNVNLTLPSRNISKLTGCCWRCCHCCRCCRRCRYRCLFRCLGRVVRGCPPVTRRVLNAVLDGVWDILGIFRLGHDV